MSDWKKQKNWSDKFIKDIKPILGTYLIGEPPALEDMERNTDLMVLKLDAVRIGCRIRKFSYLEKYADEFTIRSSLANGYKTELTKIIEGWGNYFFYGFSNEDETALAFWTLADMNVFRLDFARSLIHNKGVAMGNEKKNHDGSSSFRAFKWNDFQNNFIIAQHKGEIDEKRSF